MTLHGRNGLKQAVVQYRDGKNDKIRLQDFHPINTTTDPTHRDNMALSGYVERMRILPTSVQHGTLAPINIRRAKRYPDALYWAQAYDGGPHNLDSEGIVDWSQEMQLGTKNYRSRYHFVINGQTMAKIAHERPVVRCVVI